MSNSKYKSADFLQDLQDHTIAVLTQSDLGITQDVAIKIARELTDLTRKNWGGSNIYFPVNDFGKLSERDHEIYSKFNGSNHFDLSREYNVSEIYIYRIVKYKRAEDIAKRQTTFLDD